MNGIDPVELAKLFNETRSHLEADDVAEWEHFHAEFISHLDPAGLAVYEGDLLYAYDGFGLGAYRRLQGLLETFTKGQAVSDLLNDEGVVFVGSMEELLDAIELGKTDIGSPN
jgi:hypothetical protein